MRPGLTQKGPTDKGFLHLQHRATKEPRDQDPVAVLGRAGGALGNPEPC